MTEDEIQQYRVDAIERIKGGASQSQKLRFAIFECWKLQYPLAPEEHFTEYYEKCMEVYVSANVMSMDVLLSKK